MDWKRKRKKPFPDPKLFFPKIACSRKKLLSIWFLGPLRTHNPGIYFGHRIRVPRKAEPNWFLRKIDRTYLPKHQVEERQGVDRSLKKRQSSLVWKWAFLSCSEDYFCLFRRIIQLEKAENSSKENAFDRPVSSDRSDDYRGGCNKKLLITIGATNQGFFTEKADDPRFKL